MPQIISIVGTSGSGKTTLIEKVVSNLKSKEYKVGVIKHAAHGFDHEPEGKDSRRHFDAGADSVIVSSPGSFSLVKRTDKSESIDYLTTFFADMDIVIVEGFKRSDLPKIEVFRKETEKSPVCIEDKNLKAFVTNSEIRPGVPVFGLDDTESLSEFIIETCGQTNC